MTRRTTWDHIDGTGEQNDYRHCSGIFVFLPQLVIFATVFQLLSTVKLNIDKLKNKTWIKLAGDSLAIKPVSKKSKRGSVGGKYQPLEKLDPENPMPPKRSSSFSVPLFVCLSIFVLCAVFLFVADAKANHSPPLLRFGQNGRFKILQVADMHHADGKSTPCEDVLPEQEVGCSDLNTTAFVERMIQAEKPDLIVFTGDNIYGPDATDAAESLNACFASAISSGIPWAAVIGNHDQESTLSREGVMRHIIQMDRTVSRLNPTVSCDGEEIDGFGNYNLEVAGVEGSGLQNKSVLNLYFLDSGDYSTVPAIPGYGWIKPSQQLWFQRTSSKLQKEYMSGPNGPKQPAPGLAYFHIPLPEFSSFDTSNFTGVKQESISSASINSGFFTTMVEAGDVRAVFTGHDHVNDFCGKLMDIDLCYAGGFGYHAYGKAGWSRRARVVLASLEKTEKGGWRELKSIKTWKRLDDPELSTINVQTLWIKSSTGRRRKGTSSGN